MEDMTYQHQLINWVVESIILTSQLKNIRKIQLDIDIKHHLNAKNWFALYWPIWRVYFLVEKCRVQDINIATEKIQLHILY